MLRISAERINLDFSSDQTIFPISLRSDFTSLRQGAQMARPDVTSIEIHTMGESLYRYLEIKMHPFVLQQNLERIIIVGEHARCPPAQLHLGKNDKPFHWQRPTATVFSSCLTLHCFPGRDYVKHYASLVATYLALAKKNPDVVEYHEPSMAQCIDPLMKSNLPELGQVDIVVLGYVHGPTTITSGKWQGGDENMLFAWQMVELPSGRSVAFPGCRVSFWGDIAGKLVRALHHINKVKCILYLGELGSLRPENEPNKWLATGNRSRVDGRDIEWVNVLQPFVSKQKNVNKGSHISLPSVLDESKLWLETNKTMFKFVDPEIGHMAMSALKEGIQFAYLHIISDNLARKYVYDLSNERLRAVLEDRKARALELEEIILRFFNAWESQDGEETRMHC